MHAPENRRMSLGGMLALAMVLALNGCGFHLRGDYALPERVSPLRISGMSRFSEFHRRLAQRLEASGVSVAGDSGDARTVLELRDYGGDQFVTALDDDGKAAEYELSRAVSFSLRDAATRELLIPWRRLEDRRLYSFVPDSGFGKAMEREEIIDQLDRAMVENILRVLDLQLR